MKISYYERLRAIKGPTVLPDGLEYIELRELPNGDIPCVASWHQRADGQWELNAYPVDALLHYTFATKRKLHGHAIMDIPEGHRAAKITDKNEIDKCVRIATATDPHTGLPKWFFAIKILEKWDEAQLAYMGYSFRMRRAPYKQVASMMTQEELDWIHAYCGFTHDAPDIVAEEFNRLHGIGDNAKTKAKKGRPPKKKRLKAKERRRLERKL